MAQKILVCDDSRTIQRAVEISLFGKEIELIRVTEPGQVVSVAREIAPAMILLDNRMNREGVDDGYELCQALKNSGDTAHIPVIFLGGRSFDPQRGRDSGAFDFVEKPFETKILREKVEGVLSVDVASSVRVTETQNASPFRETTALPTFSPVDLQGMLPDRDALSEAPPPPPATAETAPPPPSLSFGKKESSSDALPPPPSLSFGKKEPSSDAMPPPPSLSFGSSDEVDDLSHDEVTSSGLPAEELVPPPLQAISTSSAVATRPLRQTPVIPSPSEPNKDFPASQLFRAERSQSAEPESSELAQTSTVPSVGKAPASTPASPLTAPETSIPAPSTPPVANG
ncbi:MAG: response regulator, partial [Myxococcota bacterium]